MDDTINITPGVLKETLRLHALWLDHEPGGVRADLEGADLTGADLEGADLTGADLEGADLTGADLEGAKLAWAKLAGAKLAGADLAWADLEGAKLAWADLAWADLEGADLTGANLYGANLSGANLSGADLEGAKLAWAKGIVSFGPIGAEGRMIGYAVLAKGGVVMIQLGCFWGTLEEAVAAIAKKYGEGSTYAAVVKAAAESLLA